MPCPGSSPATTVGSFGVLNGPALPGSGASASPSATAVGTAAGGNAVSSRLSAAANASHAEAVWAFPATASGSFGALDVLGQSPVPR